MHIPTPPWYASINKRLEGSERLTNSLLIAIILISLYLLLTKHHALKLGWVVYVISP